MIEEGLTLLSLSFFLCYVDEFTFKGVSKKKECSFKEKYFLLFIFCPHCLMGNSKPVLKIFFLKITLKYVFFTFYFLKIRI